MSSKWRVGAGAVLLVLFIVAGACGSDDGGEGDRPRIPDSVNVTTIPPGAPLIDQDNLAFEPKELTVEPGVKVYFKNSETAIHTVTIDGENVSGAMKRDAIIAWAPPRAGTYRITCDYHPRCARPLSWSKG